GYRMAGSALAPRGEAGEHLVRVDKSHKNSHMAAALRVRVRMGGPLARSLPSLKDNGGWLRQSWLTGARREMPPPTTAPQGARCSPQRITQENSPCHRHHTRTPPRSPQSRLPC